MVVDSVLILCALLKSPHRNSKDLIAQASSSSTKKVKRADLDSMQRMQFCLKLLT